MVQKSSKTIQAEIKRLEKQLQQAKDREQEFVKENKQAASIAFGDYIQALLPCKWNELDIDEFDLVMLSFVEHLEKLPKNLDSTPQQKLTRLKGLSRGIAKRINTLNKDVNPEEPIFEEEEVVTMEE